MYHTIMVPLDGSSLGEYALPLALGIARRAGAAVDLVHACSTLGRNAFGGELDAPVLSEIQHEQLRLQSQAYLEQLDDRLSAHWQVAITTTMLDGRVADVLYDHALASHADLVVMTTHGYGSLSRAWMGSVADRLVRRLPDCLVEQGSIAIGRSAGGELDELPPPHCDGVRRGCRLGQHCLQSVVEPH